MSRRYTLGGGNSGPGEICLYVDNHFRLTEIYRYKWAHPKSRVAGRNRYNEDGRGAVVAKVVLKADADTAARLAATEMAERRSQ